MSDDNTRQLPTAPCSNAGQPPFGEPRPDASQERADVWSSQDDAYAFDMSLRSPAKLGYSGSRRQRTTPALRKLLDTASALRREMAGGVEPRPTRRPW